MCNNDCNCGAYTGATVQTLSSGKNSLVPSTGDSRKIRIGNDVKLDVTIQELNGMDIINIKALKCIITNTTPMLQDHMGNAYEIHRCGLPKYHCLPAHINGVCTWKEPYNGFGMYPCMHKNWALHPHYDYFYRNPYGRTMLKCINPECKPFEFIAPVKALPDRNKVRVFFPASALMLCGLYSLTFIVDLYEPGYHSNDLRTITVDYNNIFELVPNMEGAAGDITIDIDKQIGLNAYDKYMFGNCNSCNCGSYNTNDVNSTASTATIIGNPNGVLVGTIEEFSVTGNNIPSKVNWEISSNGAASLVKAYGNIVQVFGNKIHNSVDGYETAILTAELEDGTIISKPIRIHNYAVDIDYGTYKAINLTNGQSITSTVYVTQEDGTRLSVCERGGCCQSIEVVEAEITGQDPDFFQVVSGVDSKQGSTCTWTYDDTDGNTSSAEINDSETSVVSRTERCAETKLTVNNLNTTSSKKTAILHLVSNMNGADGNPIEKNIPINGIGGSDNPDEPEELEEDNYIDSGVYNPSTNSIRFSYQQGSTLNPFNVTLDGITDIDENYWYSE